MANETYYIGQIFEGIYPPEAAIWCNSHNAYIDKIGDKRYEIKEVPVHVPTKEEQEQARASAYQSEVDPITSHISRLRDEEQTEEIIADIEALKAERAEKVEEIKQRYPYPTDPIYVDELEESANEEVEESSEEVSE